MFLYKKISLAACLVSAAVLILNGCSSNPIVPLKTQEAETEAVEDVDYAVTPYPVVKAEEDQQMEMSPLNPDTEYYFDLDFDGTDEKIFYTAEVTADYDEIPHLFINDVEILLQTKGTKTGYGTLYLMDIDSTDSRLELHFDWKGLSDTLVLYNFLHYDKGIVTTVADLIGSTVWEGKGKLSRIWGMDYAENGSIKLWVDTPIYSDTFGCYFAGIHYELKDGKLIEVLEEEYEIRATDPVYQYHAKTSFVTTTEPEESQLAFPVETEQVIAIDRIALIGEDIYVRAVNIQGEYGWFLTGEDMFTAIPGWG